MNCFGTYVLKVLKKEVANHRYASCLVRSFAFKSAYSLEHLYPKSNFKLYTPTFVPLDPKAKFDGYLPLSELDITYSRSSGPGGQNINRVNTKVDLRFRVKEAKWLSEDIREKLLEQQKSKINNEGYLIIRSELTRSQQLNLADALEKLRAMIRKTLEEPAQMSPETEEKIRKRQIKAARQRVFEKRTHSHIKEDRRGPTLD